MKLSDQVVSLEIAKRLCELGVKQDSLFLWYGENGKYGISYTRGKKLKDSITYSAFTCSELGNMLPLWWDIGKRDEKDYICRFYSKNTDRTDSAFDENQATALAKMLIWLIEKGYMKV